jgi:hypothetical protein
MAANLKPAGGHVSLTEQEAMKKEKVLHKIGFTQFAKRHRK